MFTSSNFSFSHLGCLETFLRVWMPFPLCSMPCKCSFAWAVDSSGFIYPTCGGGEGRGRTTTNSRIVQYYAQLTDLPTTTLPTTVPVCTNDSDKVDITFYFDASRRSSHAERHGVLLLDPLLGSLTGSVAGRPDHGHALVSTGIWMLAPVFLLMMAKADPSTNGQRVYV